MSINIEIIQILNQLRLKVETGEDGVIYGDRSKALTDIDSLLLSPTIKGVNDLIAPTGNLQELAIENGWGDEFNHLAEKLESLLVVY